ncbi:hypothetical protein DFH27DRAFT_192852 [Peziza echinospora]|nr:hypothetical protein DFH27DRAFT_192852 [Peziza echinospora]
MASKTNIFDPDAFPPAYNAVISDFEHLVIDIQPFSRALGKCLPSDTLLSLINCSKSIRQYMLGVSGFWEEFDLVSEVFIEGSVAEAAASRSLVPLQSRNIKDIRTHDYNHWATEKWTKGTLWKWLAREVLAIERIQTLVLDGMDAVTDDVFSMILLGPNPNRITNIASGAPYHMPKLEFISVRSCAKLTLARTKLIAKELHSQLELRRGNAVTEGRGETDMAAIASSYPVKWLRLSGAFVDDENFRRRFPEPVFPQGIAQRLKLVPMVWGSILYPAWGSHPVDGNARSTLQKAIDSIMGYFQRDPVGIQLDIREHVLDSGIRYNCLAEWVGMKHTTLTCAICTQSVVPGQDGSEGMIDIADLVMCRDSRCAACSKWRCTECRRYLTQPNAILYSSDLRQRITHCARFICKQCQSNVLEKHPWPTTIKERKAKMFFPFGSHSNWRDDGIIREISTQKDAEDLLFTTCYEYRWDRKLNTHWWCKDCTPVLQSNYCASCKGFVCPAVGHCVENASTRMTYICGVCSGHVCEGCYYANWLMSNKCAFCSETICNQQSCAKRCCAGGSQHKMAVCSNCFPSNVQMKAGRGMVTVDGKRFKHIYEEINFPLKWKGTQDVYIRETGIKCMRKDCEGMVYVCSVRQGVEGPTCFFENRLAVQTPALCRNLQIAKMNSEY